MELTLIILLGKLAYWFFFAEVFLWLLECILDLCGWQLADRQIKQIRSIARGCIALYFGNWVLGTPFF